MHVDWATLMSVATDTSGNDELFLHPDGLEGADEIAAFLAAELGPQWTPRRVDHLASVGRWPIWHEPGVGLMARKSSLRAYLQERERSAIRKMPHSVAT